MANGQAGFLANFRRALGLDPARLRWLWLGGALVLIAAGIGLALFGGSGEKNSDERVVVALPPAPSQPGRATLLLPAPDPDLIEDTPNGLLPIIGRDGRQPWRAYARPFDRTDKRPRIALLVTGIGLDRTLTQAALDRLPGTVSFSFNPYTADIKKSMADARSLGHETFIGVPLEPVDYPREDPGPLTLLTSLDQGQNMARLHRLMGEAVGYVGLVATYGARFESERTSLLPVLQDLKQRGLMLADNRPPDQSMAAPLAAQIKLPWISGNRVIDAESDPGAVDQALSDLEGVAQRTGAALGMATVSPALLDRIAAWLNSLEGKGFILAPATAIVGRQATAAPQAVETSVPAP